MCKRKAPHQLRYRAYKLVLLVLRSPIFSGEVGSLSKYPACPPTHPAKFYENGSFSEGGAMTGFYPVLSGLACSLHFLLAALWQFIRLCNLLVCLNIHKDMPGTKAV